MRRSLYLLSPVLMLLMVGVAVAQTMTADNPPAAPQALWEIILKLGFPVLMTAVGPYMTGLITSNFAKVHPSVQYAITSLLTVIMGALAGQIPAFPLSSESAATLALAAGNTGQFMANSQRTDFHPKTSTAKVEIAKLPKAERDGASV